ncbi:MAG: hypothetical protein ACYTGS_04420 [Planctomycetota bacterium]
MKKLFRTLMLTVPIALVTGGMVSAQQRDRDGAVRGVFVRLIEREVEGRGYIGIVVKPFERDDHVTVIVPWEREELWRAARGLQEGDRLGISFVNEAGHHWIKSMEAERRREESERGREGGRRIEVRREVRGEPERRQERREGERRTEIRREMRRGPEDMYERREGDRRMAVRREVRRGPEGPREGRGPRRGLPHEQLERQLREVLAGHIERLGMAASFGPTSSTWRESCMNFAARTSG